MARRRFRVSLNRKINIWALSIKIGMTIFALYVGGYFITIVGTIMNSTCSPYYKGLELIGWTVGSAVCETTGVTDANTITATSSAGILSIVGLIGITSILFSFVNIRM